mmetsp:Transcript_44361/g.135197  ORF Transcript_44361/g.135197 Transcript_44361/m.135197 type:complete len:228 (+) Transcript_44361:211-894(+)
MHNLPPYCLHQCFPSLLILLSVMPQSVQEALPLIVADGHVLSPWTPIEGPDVPQGSLGRGPIGKDRPGGHVKHPQSILIPPAPEGENVRGGVEGQCRDGRADVQVGREGGARAARGWERRITRRAAIAVLVEVDHPRLGGYGEVVRLRACAPERQGRRHRPVLVLEPSHARRPRASRASNPSQIPRIHIPVSPARCHPIPPLIERQAPQSPVYLELPRQALAPIVPQ